MGLLSIFKRRAATPLAVESGDAVQRARTRARRRVIGAVVLVGVGIIGFPIVFETQPRPISVDIPIEIPRKDGAPALVMPAARAPGNEASASAAQVPSATASAADSSGGSVASSPKTSGAAPETLSPKAGAAPGAALGTRAGSKPAARPQASPEARPAKAAAESKSVASPASDGARASSLLEGSTSGQGAAGSGRFVLQVGAFADAGAAHEARSKAEKLGMKTYTQVVNTSAGSRIRVRIGPFASREQADGALSKARAAGITAIVVTL